MPKFAFFGSRVVRAPLDWCRAHPGISVAIPIGIVYLALVVPTALPQGINWDERVDLTIASDYLGAPDGFIVGSEDDKSQTRLPMYSVALISLIAGPLSLAMARAVSIAVSALTLLGVHVFCRRHLDATKAAVATAIVATSPYFLTFAGLAFTEGDVFVTCATVWALVAGSNLMRQRTVGAAVLAGFTLGLAVSSKFFAVALVLPVILVLVASGAQAYSVGRRRRPVVGAAAAVIPLETILVANGWLDDFLADLRYFLGQDLIRVELLVTLSAALLAWAWLYWRRGASILLGSAIVVTTCVQTFLIVPPVHTTNSLILRDLFAKSSTEAMTVDQVTEFALFHASVLLLKPGLLIGLGLLAGAAAALVNLRSRRELWLPLLMAASYLGFASLTPVAQTFYMMPVFPLLVILMADGLVELGRRSRPAFVAIALASVAMLGWDLATTYPTFALNGYQWTGERFWVGRATLGYRGIAQVRSDGIEDVLLWAQDHVPEGDTVLGFMDGPHIIRAVAPDPPYRYVDAIVTSPEEECPDLSCADWVFTQINTHILMRYDGSEPADSIYRYRFDRELLASEFEKVLAIRAAFDIEVAQVWRRRTAP